MRPTRSVKRERTIQLLDVDRVDGGGMNTDLHLVVGGHRRCRMQIGEGEHALLVAKAGPNNSSHAGGGCRVSDDGDHAWWAKKGVDDKRLCSAYGCSEGQPLLTGSSQYMCTMGRARRGSDSIASCQNWHGVPYVNTGSRDARHSCCATHRRPHSSTVHGSVAAVSGGEDER